MSTNTQHNSAIQKHYKPIARFSIDLEGKEACFTDPISKVERCSYPAPTAGALEYLIANIYGHPNVRYRIDKVHILNPIVFQPMYKNERSDMGSVNPETGEIVCQPSGNPMQRMTTCLRDVHYVVEFTMFYDRDYYKRKGLLIKENENAEKHIAMLTKRIKHGQCHDFPVLGLGEMIADFSFPENDFKACESVNEDYYSTYKVVKIDDYTCKTAFTRVKVRNGVLDFHGCKIHIGDKEYTQDEFLNIEWRA